MEFLFNYQTHQYRAGDGRELTLQSTFVGPDLFELLGLRPVAGRFFAQDREADIARMHFDFAKPIAR